MKTLLLPKKYLSWSQLTLWETNPDRYKREYFENKEKLDTKYLRYGKSIASKIETGDHKDELPNLVVYEIPEYRIKCEIGGVPVIGYLDGYNPSDNTFGEYKTGKHAWTPAKVQKHGQLSFYATALRVLTGSMPKYCDLHWLETVDVKGSTGDGLGTDQQVKLTGKIQSFRRHFDTRELDRMEQRITKAATEISNEYIAYLQDI